MKKNNIINENALHNIIVESVRRIISEKRNINSKKLYDIIQQHGGIKSNNGVFDIHNLTDDDIIDVISYNDLKNIERIGMRKYAKENGIYLGVADMLDTIVLKDNNYILCKLRGGRYDCITKQTNAEREKTPGDFETYSRKKEERRKNYYPRKEDYVWNNDDAEFLFHNPYFKKGEGNWTSDRKKQVMNNVKSGRKWFDNE